MLGVLWREWCWGWNCSTLATSCEELTHWKRLWCWEGLGPGGEEDDRGWDGWMASPTRWTWVWVNSRSWWWTGRPGVLQFMGSQRVGHDWATELKWTEWASYVAFPSWNFYWPYFPFARSLWLPSLLIILFLEAFCWNTSCRNRKRTLEINFLSTYKSEVLYF